ncbi:RICIN domain-containing protein [Luteipulveratus mongoliensis]|uniref:RICIN domain-containing protein n=1 Tax=Luteipulveratus mongoliensis TaxID=571913 RepID=UPI00069729BB|nr:RICIN domain-containing protein [Luteipulveratus mongoliensis]
MKKKLILGAAGLVAAAAPILAVPAMHASAAQGDPTNTFRNLASGRCLDDSNEGLRMFSCNGGDFQKWEVHKWNDDTRELRNKATGRCLDHSEAYGLRTYPCNKSKWQSWYVIHGLGRNVNGSEIQLENQQTRKVLDGSFNKPGASENWYDGTQAWV